MNTLVEADIINTIRAKLIKSIYEIPYNSKIGFYGASGSAEILKKLFEIYRPDIEVICYFDTYKEGEFLNLPVYKLGSKEFDKYYSKVDYIILSSIYDYDIFKTLKNYNFDYLNKLYLVPINLLDITENIYKNIERKKLNISLCNKDKKVYYIVFYASSLNEDVVLKLKDKKNNYEEVLIFSPKNSLVPIKLNLSNFSDEIILEIKNANIIAFFDVNKIKINKNFKKNYKYSIIIVNYNTENYILELLKSINENTYDNLEIIIVDNKPQGLDDLLKENLKKTKTYSKIKYVPSNKNLGYAGGINLGSLFTSGDIIHILNPDIILPPKFYETVNKYINLYGLDNIYGHPYITSGSLIISQNTVCGVKSIFSSNLYGILNSSLVLCILGASCLIPVNLLGKFPKNMIYNDYYFMDADDLDFSLFTLSLDLNNINLFDEDIITLHKSNVSFALSFEKRNYINQAKFLYIYYKYYKYFDLPIEYHIKTSIFIRKYGLKKVILNLLKLIENSYLDIFKPKEKINNDMNFWFKYSGFITLEDITNERNVWIFKTTK